MSHLEGNLNIRHYDEQLERIQIREMKQNRERGYIITYKLLYDNEEYNKYVLRPRIRYLLLNLDTEKIETLYSKTFVSQVGNVFSTI